MENNDLQLAGLEVEDIKKTGETIKGHLEYMARILARQWNRKMVTISICDYHFEEGTPLDHMNNEYTCYVQTYRDPQFSTFNCCEEPDGMRLCFMRTGRNALHDVINEADKEIKKIDSITKE